MMPSSLEENRIYVILHMTVLFIQMTSPFQYYHPDKNGKTTGNEAEYSGKKKHIMLHTKQFFVAMVSLCEAEL